MSTVENVASTNSEGEDVLYRAVRIGTVGGRPVYVQGTIALDPDGNPAAASGSTGELPVQGVIDMPAANTDYTAGRGVEVIATTAGTVTLTYADGSTRTRSFAVGLTRLPDAVTKWVLPGDSTFAGTLCNLK